MKKRTAIVTAALLLAFACGLVFLAQSTERAIIRLQKRGIALTSDTVCAAAREGDVGLLCELRRAHVSFDGHDSGGVTPLIAALRADASGAASYLLDRVRHIDRADRRGMTALSHAALLEEWEFASRLLERGASIDFIVGDGRPAIVEAAASQHGPLLDFLLERGVDVDARDGEGMTALSYAVALGDHELLEELLTRGADCDARDARGNAAVLTAVRRADLESLRALVAHGADLAPPHGEGVTLLAIAVGRNDLEMASFLLDSGVRPDPESEGEGGSYPLLMTALEGGDEALVRKLISAGAPLEVADDAGRTPLGLIIAAKERDLFDLFLKRGVDPCGDLWAILESGDEEMVAAVLSRGCDLEVADGRGETALGRAIRGGKIELAEELLAAGADPNTKCGDGQAVLAWAVARREAGLVETLLRCGADANARLRSPVSAEFRKQFGEDHVSYYLSRDSSITPLMVAVGVNDKVIVRRLMEHGARTSVYTKRHKTYPIHFATRRGDTEMMQILLGRDPQKESEDRRIVIDISQQRAWLFRSGVIHASTPISSGKRGYETPQGEYVITNRYRHWTSTVYHSKMPYFMRLNCGDFGLHEGFVPSYPASHGCVRIPASKAKTFFEIARVGDRVTIQW